MFQMPLYEMGQYYKLCIYSNYIMINKNITKNVIFSSFFSQEIEFLEPLCSTDLFKIILLLNSKFICIFIIKRVEMCGVEARKLYFSDDLFVKLFYYYGNIIAEQLYSILGFILRIIYNCNFPCKKITILLYLHDVLNNLI